MKKYLTLFILFFILFQNIIFAQNITIEGSVTTIEVINNEPIIISNTDNGYNKYKYDFSTNEVNLEESINTTNYLYLGNGLWNYQNQGINYICLRNNNTFTTGFPVYGYTSFFACKN